MTRVLQMGKWINENFEKIFLAVGLFASFMLITFQVIYRFFIIKAGILLPVSWVEELARIVFIWISYLAVPIAIKKRDLIRNQVSFQSLNSNNFSLDSFLVIFLSQAQVKTFILTKTSSPSFSKYLITSLKNLT